MSGLVYHGDTPKRDYWFTDSTEGIAEAAAQGFAACDLNVRTCKANVWSIFNRKRRIVLVHWDKWWEAGLHPKPGTHVPRKPIEKLRLSEVENLVNPHGHPVLTAEQAALRCKIHRVIPFFEMKPSIWRARELAALRAFCGARGIKFAVMTIQAYGATEAARNRWEDGAFKRMSLAHGVGIPTMLLYRRKVDWTRWGWVLKAIKGHPGYGDVLDLPHFIRQLEGK